MCLSNQNMYIKLQRIEDMCKMYTMSRAQSTEYFLKNTVS
jgi:hypothetical protein